MATLVAASALRVESLHNLIGRWRSVAKRPCYAQPHFAGCRGRQSEGVGKRARDRDAIRALALMTNAVLAFACACPTAVRTSQFSDLLYPAIAINGIRSHFGRRPLGGNVMSSIGLNELGLMRVIYRRIIKHQHETCVAPVNL